MTIAFGQVLLRPVQRLVEVAKVAGVGHAMADAALGRRGLNLVVADPAKQRVGRVGHMAIEAVAAGGVFLMKGVLFNLCRILGIGMALDAGCIAPHVWFELIHRVTMVHRVAAQAGHLAFCVAGADAHGSELTAAGQDRAVVPPPFAEELRVFLQFLLPHRCGRGAGVLDVVANRVDVVARPVNWSTAGKLLAALRVVVNEDTMALAANLA